jgi:hypothetical protein
MAYLDLKKGLSVADVAIKNQIPLARAKQLKKQIGKNGK